MMSTSAPRAWGKTRREGSTQGLGRIKTFGPPIFTQSNLNSVPIWTFNDNPNES